MSKQTFIKSDRSQRKKRVTLSLKAPEAQAVIVTGTFCDWQTDSLRLKKDNKGTWMRALSLPPGRYEYRFLVDGEWHDDPKCTDRVPNVFGTEKCVLHVLRDELQHERYKTADEGVP